MKSFCFFAVLVFLISAPLSILAADEGADIYKTKCAMCHGEKGEGKPAMKMPAVKGTQMTAEQIVNYLTTGVAGKRMPHMKPISGLTADQAKSVAEYVKTLQ